MSNGARAGLTGFVAGLARQVARHNVTINGLLPGPFLTDRLRSGIEFEARRQNISFEEMLARALGHAIPAGRVGDPEEFGDACAFLCAASLRLYRRAEPAARRRRVQLDDGIAGRRSGRCARRGSAGCGKPGAR